MPWMLALSACLCSPAGAEPTAKPPAKAPAKPAPPAPKDKPAGYLVEPAPAWVVPATEVPGTRLERAPMHYRVIDQQIRVDDKTSADYNHVVRVIDETAGLAVASQIEIEFNPAYQTLALHHLDVVRDGKRLNRLDRRRIQLLQRETQLERRMVDGRLTMSVIVDDVRVGDQIDFAYTVRGSNPVFDGKFADVAWLSSHRGPVALYQLRLLAPAERRILQRIGPNDVTTETRLLGTHRETLIRRSSVPQMRADPGAPHSVFLAQQVRWSEYADWAEVARWGEGLFQQNTPQRLVDQKAAEIRAASPDRAQQLLAALTFVQQNIRYFGTEVGVNSHRPVAPDRVIEQRYGDCKDKVGLLVALLRRLDIPATPVLVSMGLKREVATFTASPLAFDHVIAKVDLDGTTYWLDATRGHQTGTLANRQAQGFGLGLPLDRQTTALAALPTPYDSLRMVVEDRLRVTQFATDPTLTSRITYRGDLAELYREALAHRSLTDIAADLAEPYVKLYPKITATAPVQVEQASDDDALTFVQTFSVPEFWRYPDQRVLAADLGHWGAAQALSLPKSETRRDPLGFNFPGRYRHAISIDFPEDVFRQGSSQRFDESQAQITLKTQLEATRRRVDFDTEVRIGTDQLAPADWQPYTAKLTRYLPKLSSVTAVSAIPLDRLPALERDLKAQEEALRSGRLKATTKVQMEAVFKTVALSAQLAGGRLSPALEAQALLERGTQYDHQGRPELGRADFDRALALAPGKSEVQQAAAVNAMQLQEFDRAISLADQVLAQHPSDNEALDVRARARYFKAEWPAAQADWNALLQDRAALRRGYPVVWLALVTRQQGGDATTLNNSYPTDHLPTDWPRPLVEFALGKTNAEALIRAAKAEKNATESLCEAYFYIGEQYRTEGDMHRAVEYWRRSADLGVREFIEDAAARFRLATAAK